MLNPKYPQLGALKDPVDPRDFPFDKIVAPVPLPAAVDYEATCTPVRDQGQRGSCVAFAAIATKEQHLNAKGTGVDLSEEYLYDQIMQKGGGAFPRSAYKEFVKQGALLENDLPYNPTEQDQTPVHLKPNAQQLQEATQYKSKVYARLRDLNHLKQALAQQGSILIGVDWLDGWFHPTTLDSNGYPILDLGQGQVVGGHALCIVGYDDNSKVFKFKNSWGTGWGKNGFAYFTYNAIEANINDAWSEIDLTQPNVNIQAIESLTKGDK